MWSSYIYFRKYVQFVLCLPKVPTHQVIALRFRKYLKYYSINLEHADICNWDYAYHFHLLVIAKSCKKFRSYEEY